MSKIKKMFAIIMGFVLICCFGINAFASETKLPDNFHNLSVEQRIRWLDENIPQITEDATCVGMERSNIRKYTARKTTFYEDEMGTEEVGIAVRYNWSVESDQIIESYEVAEFSTYIYNPSFVFIDKDVTSYYLTDGNVKIYPEATFVCAYLGVLVGQNVNLHASGKISYAAVSQPFA